MKIHNLDKKGDWIFGGGYGNYVEGKDAIALDIKTKLYSWIGDCFYDLDMGIDWKTYLGYKNTQNLLEYDIKSVTMNVEGVIGISQFISKLDHNTRQYTAHMEVDTIYGNITLQI